MKFNNKELFLYGTSKVGQGDKEGTLWMKEMDGIIKKKENYYKRWMVLTGNLLFYAKEETQDSPLVGVIMLEGAHAESEALSGNRNAFCITFKNCDDSFWFFTDSAREADEWIRLLNCTSYEFLRMQLIELRSQLMHLTGKDPVDLGGTISKWSTNFKPSLLCEPMLPWQLILTLPAPAPGYDGEPIFELSLSCSSLVTRRGDVVPPSSLIVTHCMTPPQAYWMRYAQTELQEENFDPQFLTPVTFFEGSIFSKTQLKFDIFDVSTPDRSLMRPLGQCQCSVHDLVKEPEKLSRFEITFDDKVSGYLTVKVNISRQSEVSRVIKKINVPTEKIIDVPSITSDEKPDNSFSFRSPISNIVVRSFKFPKWKNTDTMLKVTEIMGEGLFTYIIPMQILELCIGDENITIGQFSVFTGLSENWEIIRQEVILELRQLVEHYWKSREKLQLEAESGKLYKKSVLKDESQLEFVPVNLHVQELKVSNEENDDKEQTVYSCVTVGCPTAYSLKYRQGGLVRMQHSIPLLSSSGSFSPTSDNKSHRIKSLLKRLNQQQVYIKREVIKLTDAAAKGNYTELKQSVNQLVDQMTLFENHCNVNIVQDALKDWYKALDPTKLPSFITGLTSLSPKSVLSVIEEHMVCVEAQVDGVISSKLTPSECSQQLNGPISDLLKAIDNTIEIFQMAMFFVLLREFYSLQLNKIPIGLRGYRHRRDIVFCHVVTSAVTCFVMKMVHLIGSKQFLTQLQELGFLIHWESLLSTQGDEIGMLEDFIVGIHDLNALKFKFVLADSINELPRCQGTRYKVTVEIPLHSAIYRILPASLKEGKEISTVAVLFTQGINEQQTLADTFGDSHLQDQINIKSLQRLSQYCDKFKDRFGATGLKMSQKAKQVTDFLQQLKAQINARKTKNTDILTLSAELCRLLECGRITSCKSAKDRTGMSVTLEQAHILLSLDMDQSHMQQALDSMRSQGTRLRNAEKNIGVPLYAFNSLQVVALPKYFRPPEGTYKKLQT